MSNENPRSHQYSCLTDGRTVQDVCGRIYEILSASSATVVFKDVDSLKLGVNFKDELIRTLENCEAALIVITELDRETESGGEARIKRDYVRIEAESVLRRDIPVIPVFVRGVRAVEVEKLPETLAEFDERNCIQIRPDPDFKNDMSRLVAARSDSGLEFVLPELTFDHQSIGRIRLIRHFSKS